MLQYLVALSLDRSFPLGVQALESKPWSPSLGRWTRPGEEAAQAPGCPGGLSGPDLPSKTAMPALFGEEEQDSCCRRRREGGGGQKATEKKREGGGGGSPLNNIQRSRCTERLASTASQRLRDRYRYRV